MKLPTPHPLLLAAVALIITSAALLRAEETKLRPAVVLGNTERIELTNAKTGQRYELMVSLPDDYATSGKTYPVLYVLDGWHFPLMAFLQNNNHYSERMPPVIMVNLGHVPAAEAMQLRIIDFTPTTAAGRPTTGHAAEFLAFLEHEVMPLIERTYRTDPTDRALLGHSAGGMFALYAFVQRPGLFQRIVSASPTGGWDNRVLFAIARKNLKSIPTPVRLDLSAGDEPDVAGWNITRDTADFEALLTELNPANLEHRFTHFPGENHNSVRLASFPAGLYWAYRPADSAPAAPAAKSASAEQADIRAARLAQNAAIAAHDLAAIASCWTDDVTIRRGLGAHVAGKAGYLELFRADDPVTSLLYERVPDQIAVSPDWPLAFETGHWTGRREGVVLLGGQYSAQWVKHDGRWLIRGEVYVALEAVGDGRKLKSSPVPDARAEITALLTEFLAKNNDPAQHERFWADDVVYTSGKAEVRTKADIIKSFASAPKPETGKPKEPAETYSAEDILIRPFGDTAALTFRLVRHLANGKDEYYRNSGAFLLRDGHWQAVTWQATKAPPVEAK